MKDTISAYVKDIYNGITVIGFALIMLMFLSSAIAIGIMFKIPIIVAVCIALLLGFGTYVIEKMDEVIKNASTIDKIIRNSNLSCYLTKIIVQKNDKTKMFYLDICNSESNAEEFIDHYMEMIKGFECDVNFRIEEVSAIRAKEIEIVPLSEAFRLGGYVKYGRTIEHNNSL